MTDKFILVSLDEKRSKELAEVLSNNTSRKILDYLSDKEATSSDIHNELGIALSTVEYNLKNLVNAGLVESTHFKWSPKGRQMDIFMVKRKYIVIAPGGSNELREILKNVLPIGIFGIIIAGLMEFFTGRNIMKVPVTKEIITKTVSEGVAQKVVSETSAISAPIAQDSFKEPAVNVTMQVTESMKEIVLPNPHYGLWFLLGLVIVLISYTVYKMKFKR